MMNKVELVDLVKKIIACEETEEVMDAMIDLFDDNVPHPAGSDFIFLKKYEGLTPEEIVDKATDYQPIITPQYYDKGSTGKE